MIKLAIVGCRHGFKDFNSTIESLLQKIGYPNVIISGGASGVDAQAKHLAQNGIGDFKGCEYMEFSAEWDKYGKKAGPLRNTKIVEECTHVLAFPSKKSVGTWDTIRKAQQMKKQVIIYEI